MTHPVKLEANKPVSKVKGPIRCHKCQLKCRDAEHYLNHKCEPASLSVWSPSLRLERLNVEAGKP
jgi:hypothetical protein